MSTTRRFPAVPYVAPFVAFMACLGATKLVSVPQPLESIAWVVIVTAVIALASRDLVASIRFPRWAASIAIGVLVFVLWIAPDALLPGWRDSVIFQNGITGHVRISIRPTELADPLVMWLRIARAVILVPILEEFFWRGWLPRWLQRSSFEQIPLGTYTVFSFVVTALLFATEHGPFWEVGLVAGLIYNWWMWRSKSLGDLILAHAVTNGCLAAYVVYTHQWQFWM